MPTIDLTHAATPAHHGFDTIPRRLGLTLPEVQYAATLAGGAPLPFAPAPPAETDGLQARLGSSPVTSDDRTYRTALATLHDPAGSLERRGLVRSGRLDSALAGALGLLATPRVALDLDVRIGSAQARSWQRSRGGAVATLSTVDGIVFELAWADVAAWPTELARVAVLPDDVEPVATTVPDLLDLPWELAAAAAEATRTGRPDLVPVLVARHHGAVLGPSGPLPDAEVVRLLAAVAQTRGRLRALVADVAGSSGPSGTSGAPAAAGVVAWTLLADGWRDLRPHHDGAEPRLELRSVGPEDLAAAIAPTLAPLLEHDR